MTAERVVVDTNVPVSFFLRHGSMPWRAVRFALEADDLVMSDATYRELCNVLRRTKLDRYVAREMRESFLESLRAFATFVIIRERVEACADPTDDKFLEAAINGNTGGPGDRRPRIAAHAGVSRRPHHDPDCVWVTLSEGR